MKIDQIAWYAHNEEQVREIKRHFGLLDRKWIEDTATGNVTLYYPSGAERERGESSGLLRFNYDLGIELEILTYLSGPHWHQHDARFLQGVPFLSHVGIHMEEGEMPPSWTSQSCSQIMETTSHTNPYLIEKQRRYRYVIQNTVPLLGHYTKYIWRVHQ